MRIIDLEKTTSKIKVGRLENRVISALCLNISETDIELWYDRITHFRKHMSSYTSESEFERYINQIPDVIANPDYVAKRPNSTSIDYIKRIERLLIVAVRIRCNGPLIVRTAYILTEEQLKDYISFGSAKSLR
jgi:hypothetical protein